MHREMAAFPNVAKPERRQQLCGRRETRGPSGAPPNAGGASGAAGGCSGSTMHRGEVKRTASGSSSAGGGSSPTLVGVDHPWRQVPTHLKEVCASALVGGMKCLFRDDKPSEETMMERSNRKKLIMLRQVSAMDFNLMDPDNMEGHQVSIGTLAGGHILRDLKSKKRLMRKAARIFNQEASRGIEFLVDAGLVPDPITPSVVAAFLRNSIVTQDDRDAHSSGPQRICGGGGDPSFLVDLPTSEWAGTAVWFTCKPSSGMSVQSQARSLGRVNRKPDGPEPSEIKVTVVHWKLWHSRCFSVQREPEDSTPYLSRFGRYQASTTGRGAATRRERR